MRYQIAQAIAYYIVAVTCIAASLSAKAAEVEVDEEEELKCLSLNVYHEARSSSLADQAAVADVVLNRVKDTRYPNTICGVVYDAKTRTSWVNKSVEIPIINQCQFSWYCDGLPDKPREYEAWIQARQVAYPMFYLGHLRGITEGATHYHTSAVEPEWRLSFRLIGRIGEHIYYRWEQ